MGSRPPAPGPLETVQAFLNTIDLESHVDELASPEQAAAWLTGRGLLDPGTTLDPDDLARTVQLREILRDLLEAHHATPPHPVAIGVLEKTAAGGRLVTRFDEEGNARLEATAPALDGALAQFLAIVYTAMAEGSWYRLKVCQRDRCRWAFYDHSKNRSGTWCSMTSCGNKEKAAAFRRRQSYMHR